MNLKKVILLIVIFVSVAILSACSDGGEATPTATGEAPAVLQSMPVVADGFLVPRQHTYVTFLRNGIVEEILVQEGQLVEKGQVLARLQKTVQMDADIEKAKHELSSAERALELVGGRDAVPAQARIDSAKMQLQVAENAISELELKAPFSGTIVTIDLFVGESVTTDKDAMLLADLSEWFIETDNLTEIEVVNVSVGQQVSIKPDALPDVNMTGEVESISGVFEEKRGDITYTVKIAVGIVDPRLRWGMTMAVTFVK